jgi:hypothetical protein
MRKAEAELNKDSRAEVPVGPAGSPKLVRPKNVKANPKDQLKGAVREANEKGAWWESQDDLSKRPKGAADKLR